MGTASRASQVSERAWGGADAEASTAAAAANAACLLSLPRLSPPPSLKSNRRFSFFPPAGLPEQLSQLSDLSVARNRLTSLAGLVRTWCRCVLVSHRMCVGCSLPRKPRHVRMPVSHRARALFPPQQAAQCPALVLLDARSNAFTDTLSVLRQLSSLDDLRELSLLGQADDGDEAGSPDSGVPPLSPPAGYREAARRALPSLQVRGRRRGGRMRGVFQACLVPALPLLTPVCCHCSLDCSAADARRGSSSGRSQPRRSRAERQRRGRGRGGGRRRRRRRRRDRGVVRGWRRGRRSGEAGAASGRPARAAGLPARDGPIQARGPHCDGTFAKEDVCCLQTARICFLAEGKTTVCAQG